jgi:hypothetical protein
MDDRDPFGLDGGEQAQGVLKHRDGMSRVIGAEWPVVCVMLVER